MTDENIENKNIEEEKKLLIDFYETKINQLKAAQEYELFKVKIECENEKNKLKQDLECQKYNEVESVKKYYEHELESQRNWYEEEIIRRKKETEDWHVNNLAVKTAEFEYLLNAKDEKFNEEIKVLSEQLKTQKEYYENQMGIFSKFIKTIKKCKKKNTKEKPDEKVKTSVSEPEQNVKPKVSVILPVYNVGKYLRQSLDSLINQTLKEIEIICVDDGSVDDSYDILEEYKQKDSRIKVIHKENKGTGAARNDGLRIAEGECIGFVDPDDWVKPNMFERLYNLIKEKNLDIAMCMPDGYDEKNNKMAPFPYFVDDNFKNIIDDRIFNWRDLSPFQYPMCVWNKLYTKELFDKNHIEFAEGLDFEDHKVIFGTLLTAEKIFFIREKLYVYRYNREGSVLTDNNRRLIDHIEIFNIVEKLMKDTNTFTPLKEDFLTYKIHNILYYYSMIKPEFKQEYFEKMVDSIKKMNLTEQEYTMLCSKYPELREYVKI